MIAALFVVCASDGRSLKLSEPFSDAVFAITPRLSARRGMPHG
jgi:hypothetical protein